MRPHRFISGLMLVCFYVGAGCVSAPPKTSSPNDRFPSPIASRSREWQHLSEGADWKLFDLNATTTAIVYRFSSDHFELGLAADGPPRRVSAWREALPDARLIANGTYFNEEGEPSGFLAIGGKRLGKRSFDLDKSGFVRVGQNFALIDTSSTPIDLKREPDGFQSYPFFLIGSRPAIRQDSGFKARRTFIGQDDAGNFYIGAISRGEISLHALMLSLTGTGIPWTNALNLDGGPSTGLVPLFQGEIPVIDSLVAVPNVLFVREKNSPR